MSCAFVDPNKNQFGLGLDKGLANPSQPEHELSTEDIYKYMLYTYQPDQHDQS